MSKELKALKFIFNEALFSEFKNETHTKVRECHSIVYEALQRLEAIANANPSEALGLVKRTCEIYVDSLKQRDLIGYDIIEKQINEALDTIKQALVKSQEQEKVLEIILERHIDILNLEECIEREKMGNVASALEYYNRYYAFNISCELTQEEFDLLKRYFYE